MIPSEVLNVKVIKEKVEENNIGIIEVNNNMLSLLDQLSILLVIKS